MLKKYWIIVIGLISNLGNLIKDWTLFHIKGKDLVEEGKLVLAFNARKRYLGFKWIRYRSWMMWMSCWRSLWNMRRSGRRSRGLAIDDSFMF